MWPYTLPHVSLLVVSTSSEMCKLKANHSQMQILPPCLCLLPSKIPLISRGSVLWLGDPEVLEIFPFFPLSHPCLLASFITTRTQVLLFSPESTSRCSTSSDTKDQLLTYGVRSLPVTQLFRGLIWRLWYAISFAYLLRIPRPYSFLASEIWGQTICLLSLSLSSHYSDVSPGKTNSSFPLLLLSDFWSKAMNVWVR